MSHLIEKHQNSRGVILFSPEYTAELLESQNPFRMRSSTIPKVTRQVTESKQNQQRTLATKEAIKQDNKKPSSQRIGRRVTVASTTNPEDVRTERVIGQGNQTQLTERKDNPNRRVSDELLRQYYTNLELERRFDEEVLPATGAFMYRLAPSTLVGALADKNRSFLGSMVEGNRGLGEINPELEHANLAFDIVAPIALSKGFNLFKLRNWRNGFKKGSADNTRILLEFDNLSTADITNGAERTWSPEEVKRAYLETKRDAYKYFDSDEFKQRALAAGFTEEEYPRLVNEIRDHLQKTRFGGANYGERGAVNNGYFYDSNLIMPGLLKEYNRFVLEFYPKHSEVLMRGNIWHELMHSIAGKKDLELRYPMLNKLKAFNESVQPETSNWFLILLDPPKMADHLRSNLGRDLEISEMFDIVDNARLGNAYKSEIVNKPHEFRSRLSTVLYTLRKMGYDTSELIKNPEKFSTWITELSKNNTNMPWDLNLLLVPYSLKGLEKPAGKILTTSGGLYLGSQMFNNNQ